MRIHSDLKSDFDSPATTIDPAKLRCLFKHIVMLLNNTKDRAAFHKLDYSTQQQHILFLLEEKASNPPGSLIDVEVESEQTRVDTTEIPELLEELFLLPLKAKSETELDFLSLYETNVFWGVEDKDSKFIRKVIRDLRVEKQTLQEQQKLQEAIMGAIISGPQEKDLIQTIVKANPSCDRSEIETFLKRPDYPDLLQDTDVYEESNSQPQIFDFVINRYIPGKKDSVWFYDQEETDKLLHCSEQIKAFLRSDKNIEDPPLEIDPSESIETRQDINAFKLLEIFQKHFEGKIKNSKGEDYTFDYFKAALAADIELGVTEISGSDQAARTFRSLQALARFALLGTVRLPPLQLDHLSESQPAYRPQTLRHSRSSLRSSASHIEDMPDIMFCVKMIYQTQNIFPVLGDIESAIDESNLEQLLITLTLNHRLFPGISLPADGSEDQAILAAAFEVVKDLIEHLELGISFLYIQPDQVTIFDIKGVIGDIKSNKEIKNQIRQSIAIASSTIDRKLKIHPEDKKLSAQHAKIEEAKQGFANSSLDIKFIVDVGEQLTQCTRHLGDQVVSGVLKDLLGSSAGLIDIDDDSKVVAKSLLEKITESYKTEAEKRFQLSQIQRILRNADSFAPKIDSEKRAEFNENLQIFRKAVGQYERDQNLEDFSNALRVFRNILTTDQKGELLKGVIKFSWKAADQSLVVLTGDRDGSPTARQLKLELTKEYPGIYQDLARSLFPEQQDHFVPQELRDLETALEKYQYAISFIDTLDLEVESVNESMTHRSAIISARRGSVQSQSSLSDGEKSARAASSAFSGRVISGLGDINHTFATALAFAAVKRSRKLMSVIKPEERPSILGEVAEKLGQFTITQEILFKLSQEPDQEDIEDVQYLGLAIENHQGSGLMQKYQARLLVYEQLFENITRISGSGRLEVAFLNFPEVDFNTFVENQDFAGFAASLSEDQARKFLRKTIESLDRNIQSQNVDDYQSSDDETEFAPLNIEDSIANILEKFKKIDCLGYLDPDGDPEIKAALGAICSADAGSVNKKIADNNSILLRIAGLMYDAMEGKFHKTEIPEEKFNIAQIIEELVPDFAICGIKVDLSVKKPPAQDSQRDDKKDVKTQFKEELIKLIASDENDETKTAKFVSLVRQAVGEAKLTNVEVNDFALELGFGIDKSDIIVFDFSDLGLTGEEFRNFKAKNSFDNFFNSATYPEYYRGPKIKTDPFAQNRKEDNKTSKIVLNNERKRALLEFLERKKEPLNSGLREGKASYGRETKSAKEKIAEVESAIRHLETNFKQKFEPRGVDSEIDVKNAIACLEVCYEDSEEQDYLFNNESSTPHWIKAAYDELSRGKLKRDKAATSPLNLQVFKSPAPRSPVVQGAKPQKTGPKVNQSGGDIPTTPKTPTQFLATTEKRPNHPRPTQPLSDLLKSQNAVNTRPNVKSASVGGLTGAELGSEFLRLTNHFKQSNVLFENENGQYVVRYGETSMTHEDQKRLEEVVSIVLENKGDKLKNEFLEFLGFGPKIENGYTLNAIFQQIDISSPNFARRYIMAQAILASKTADGQSYQMAYRLQGNSLLKSQQLASSFLEQYTLLVRPELLTMISAKRPGFVPPYLEIFEEISKVCVNVINTANLECFPVLKDKLAVFVFDLGQALQKYRSNDPKKSGEVFSKIITQLESIRKALKETNMHCPDSTIEQINRLITSLRDLQRFHIGGYKEVKERALKLREILVGGKKERTTPTQDAMKQPVRELFADIIEEFNRGVSDDTIGGVLFDAFFNLDPGQTLTSENAKPLLDLVNSSLPDSPDQQLEETFLQKLVSIMDSGNHTRRIDEDQGRKIVRALLTIKEQVSKAVDASKPGASKPIDIQAKKLIIAKSAVTSSAAVLESAKKVNQLSLCLALREEEIKKGTEEYETSSSLSATTIALAAAYDDLNGSKLKAEIMAILEGEAITSKTEQALKVEELLIDNKIGNQDLCDRLRKRISDRIGPILDGFEVVMDSEGDIDIHTSIITNLAAIHREILPLMPDFLKEKVYTDIKLDDLKELDFSIESADLYDIAEVYLSVFRPLGFDGFVGKIESLKNEMENILKIQDELSKRISSLQKRVVAIEQSHIKQKSNIEAIIRDNDISPEEVERSNSAFDEDGPTDSKGVAITKELTKKDPESPSSSPKSSGRPRKLSSSEIGNNGNTIG